MDKLKSFLRRYICAILLTICVFFNSLAINDNTSRINGLVHNQNLLASSLAITADSVVRFATNYNQTFPVLEKQIQGISLIYAGTIQDIFNMKEVVKQIKTESENINLTFVNYFNKPSYDYLKSVTVYLKASATYVAIDKNGKVLTEPVKWCGTGVVVKIDEKYTYVLTNCHVAGENDEHIKEVYLYAHENERKYFASVIKVHKELDMALIKIKGSIPGKNFIKGIALPIVAERIYTVGQSLSRPYIYGEGIFSGSYGKDDIYQLPTIGGQSGSGVFNSKGFLTGLLYSVAGTNSGFMVQWDYTRGNAVRSSDIHLFLQENL